MRLVRCCSNTHLLSAFWEAMGYEQTTTMRNGLVGKLAQQVVAVILSDNIVTIWLY